jgi:uncharacterized membrane protein YvbJ
MGKTICCNCNKEIGRMQFKFSYSELWDVSSHPKVSAMNSDDKLCSNCKKLFDDEINQSKEEMQTRTEMQPENTIKPNSAQSVNFCPKCGQEVIENAIFCVGCGLDIGNVKATSEIKKSYQSTAPKEVVLTKYQSVGNKVSIVSGAIVILLALVVANPYYVIIGIAMLVIGFVSLKNKSKTIDQFLSIVNLILFAIIIMNLLEII